MFWSLILASCVDYTLLVTDTSVIHERDPQIVIDSREAVEQRLDILFIIDESCSMNEEQTMLADNMKTFLSPFSSEEYDSIDWQAGIQSTNPNDLYARGWVMASEWPDPVGMVSNWINFMDTTCTYEEPNPDICEAGLDAALISNIYDPNHRDSADLLVIWVSDEIDHSSNTPDSYLAQSSGFRPSPFTTFNASITNLDGWSDCLGRTTTEGTGYIEASTIAVDFCDYDHWGDTLILALEHVANINKMFYLTYTPLNLDATEIAVFIDGIKMPDTTWTWLIGSNAVYFENPPAPGANVMIVYQTADEIVVQ